MDYFSQLLQLKVLETAPEELLNQASETLVKGDQIFYYFDSEKYSQPHWLALNKDKVITEISLTIPAAERQNYQTQLEGLGEPEARKTLTDVQKFFAFPSKGTSFIVDAANKPLKVIFNPTTSTQEFVAEKLDPISTEKVIEVDDRALEPIATNQVNQTPQLYAVGFLILVLVVAAWLVLKRRKETTSSTTPPIVS